MDYPVVEADPPLLVAEPEPGHGPGKSRWQQYFDLLVARKVPEKARRYYCQYVEALLSATDRTPVRQLSREALEKFFRAQSARGQLEDWQLRQCVHAIKLLLVDLANAPAAREIDWAFWRDGQASLEGGHASLAREDSVGRSAHRFAVRFGSTAQESFLVDLITAIRTRHYSIRTEQAYSQWVARFLSFCAPLAGAAPPRESVGKFLEHLAVERNVAASTQSQALNALVFFYTQVLDLPLDDLQFARPRKPKQLPVVLSRDEVVGLLGNMQGLFGLMAGLLYGTGMRLMECVRLRVKDVDFSHCQSIVRSGKQLNGCPIYGLNFARNEHSQLYMSALKTLVICQ